MRDREIKFVEDIKTLYEEKKDLEEVVRNLSLMLNCFGVSKKEIAEAIIRDSEASENMREISRRWIQILMFQEAAGFYDGRNEYSVKLAGEIAEKLRIDMDETIERDLRSYKRSADPIDYICCAMHFEHRTLQQTFSGIVFGFLSISEEALESFKDFDWWRCPMI